MDAELIADLFRGEIATWRDRRIKELSPAVRLPDPPVSVVHRSDSSATTANFTAFLTDRYVELTHTLEAGLPVADVENVPGRFVSPAPDRRHRGRGHGRPRPVGRQPPQLHPGPPRPPRVRRRQERWASPASSPTWSSGSRSRPPGSTPPQYGLFELRAKAIDDPAAWSPSG